MEPIIFDYAGRREREKQAQQEDTMDDNLYGAAPTTFGEMRMRGGTTYNQKAAALSTAPGDPAISRVVRPAPDRMQQLQQMVLDAMQQYLALYPADSNASAWSAATAGAGVGSLVDLEGSARTAARSGLTLTAARLGIWAELREAVFRKLPANLTSKANKAGTDLASRRAFLNTADGGRAIDARAREKMAAQPGLTIAKAKIQAGRELLLGK